MNNENNTQFIARRPATQTPIPPTPADHQGKGQPLLHIGEKLGNYRLMRLLAQGGFADVYLGEHIHLGTEAAIKVLRTRLSSKDLLTFREEARIVARLHHSHIVTIFDFDVQNGIPFIVMDYAPNGTLRQRHPKGSVLAPATIIPYLKQVADALQHGHDQQVVHRDVKPENMLIGRKNDILLSDFGIATMLQNAHPTANQKIIGTATYMSPEQFQGHAFPASDQYSLAVIAYEWLAGECPFTGSVSQIATQHMQDPPPSLCKRNPQISPALEQVVFQALAKYPAQRFASVTEFADAFADASPQQVLVLRNPGRSPRQPIAPANNDQTTFIPLGQAQQNHTQAAPQQQQRPGGVSRRAVVVGLAGLTTVGIAGAAAWAVSRAGLFSPSANNQAATQATKTPALTPSPTAPITGKLLTTYTKHDDSVTTVAWMPGNSGIVASGSKDKVVRVWHANGGTDIHSYAGHEDTIGAVAWSPDGQFIASASNDNTVHVWTAQQDGLDFTYNRHERDVRSVAWSRDSQLIASGSRDATVRLWHAQSGDDVGVFKHDDQVWAVAWSSDGRYIASAGDDKIIRVWNPAKVTNQGNGDGEEGNNKHNKHINNQAIIASFEGSEDSVRALAWSPNNLLLASGGEDNTVRIWLLNGNTPTVTYRQHSGTVLAVAWSPDGQKIASASADGTVRIWKASNGSDLYVYKGHNGNEVNTVAWSADGKYLASGGADKTVQIWSA
jgi:WD40 repeat protein